MTENKTVLAGAVKEYFGKEIPYDNQFITTERQDHSISVSKHGIHLQLSTALIFYAEHMSQEQTEQFITLVDDSFGDEQRSRMTEETRQYKLGLPNIRLTQESLVAFSEILSRWVDENFENKNASVTVMDTTEPHEVTYVDYRITIPLSDSDAPISAMLEDCLPLIDFLYEATDLSYNDHELTTPVFNEVTRK